MNQGEFLRNVKDQPPAVSNTTKGIQCKRFSVCPGITCLWQVSGPSNLSFDNWLRPDLEYVDDWVPRPRFSDPATDDFSSIAWRRGNIDGTL